MKLASDRYKSGEKIFVLGLILVLSFSGCVENDKYLNIEYPVYSVNEYFVNGNVVHSVVYSNETNVLLTLQEDGYNELTIMLSNKTYLVLNSIYTKTDYSNPDYYWTLYLNNQTLVTPKDSEWTECHLVGKITSCKNIQSIGRKLQ